MSRTYFFRDSEGYDLDEMRSRVRVRHFRDPDFGPVNNIIETSDVNPSDLSSSQQELHSTLRRKLGSTRYKKFIKNVFELRGEKGDRFNLQLYTTDELNYDDLVETVRDNVSDKDPEGLLQSSVYNSLIRVEERGDGILDLRFVIPDRVNYINNEEDEDDTTPEAVLSDHLYVEVRIYSQQNIVAVSRRAVNEDQQESVWRTLNSWTGDALNRYSRTRGLNLSPNEMLALQNAMDGENTGIDYGDFAGGKNIKTAKYRGANNLNPTESDIVEPASVSGRIVQLRFHHSYGTGQREREVLIRLYQDGHLTASKPTEPDCIDALVKHLDEIRSHSDYLETMSSQISEYKWEIMSDNLAEGPNTYIDKKNLALRSAIDDHLDDSQIETVEIQMFRDLLFSLGVGLLEADDTPEVDDDIADPEMKPKLEGLFDDYARYQMSDPNYDFDQLWTQLHTLVTSDFTSPVELIQQAKDEFQI